MLQRVTTAFCRRAVPLLFILVAISTVQASAQDSFEQKIYTQLPEASTDRDKLALLSQLSDYYYANKDFHKGDSIIERQIMIAEASRNRNIIISTLFGNAGYNSGGLTTRERSQKTIDYINRALEFARTAGLNDYTALAYSNLARLYNTDGKLEEAFNHANLGFTTALSSSNDSVQVLCALELGNIYMQQGKILMAYKTFTNAYDIANKERHSYLFPVVYHSISDLYKKLGRFEEAKDYIFRSLEINRKNANIAGQVDDYISLGKIYPYAIAKDYLLMAERLADSIHNNRMKLDAQRKLFSYMMLEEDPQVALAYLSSHEDLANMLDNTGPNYLDWVKGEVYLWGDKPDSALQYFRKAEAAISGGYDFSIRKAFYGDLALCYKKLGDIPNSIRYYQKTIELSRIVSDLFLIKDATNELKLLNEQRGDFQQAYYYSTLYNHYKDTVDRVSRDRDLALLEIANENKRREREAQLQKEQQLLRYNLQYMGITIVIATAFILLIAMGMFKVSQVTVRAVGFLSFIFLFEFIIMILDNWIHHITHGEPLKVWLIKIGIISILLPLHHYIEHKVIRYLLSRKLLHSSRSLSFRAIINYFKVKAKAPQAVPEEKEGTTTIIEEPPVPSHKLTVEDK